jgi:hypothetical protein
VGARPGSVSRARVVRRTIDRVGLWERRAVGSTSAGGFACYRWRRPQSPPPPSPALVLVAALSLASVRTRAQCSTRRRPSRALFLGAPQHGGLPFRWPALAASFALVYLVCVFFFPFLLRSSATFPVSLLQSAGVDLICEWRASLVPSTDLRVRPYPCSLSSCL